jgi:hypothetical protein
MNYSIKLKKSLFEQMEKVSRYSFINEDNHVETFMIATHASFSYYKEKTPNITVVDETAVTKKLGRFTEGELCITVASTPLIASLYNVIHKNKNILYLPKNEVYYDIERTWKIIQEKRNLETIKTIYFHLESPSKIVYAYRAIQSYNLEVKDITY